MPVPDVTVITPVHNTRPYLDAWFSSLLQQSIGLPRIEVIAVDDGSHDGSAAELDRLAGLHPGLLTVVALPDRGGPARARNLALDLATGRYLFFLDSDDYLGPEALGRMVAAADEHGSDIVLGRVVGVNGRWVPAFACRATDHDVRFPDGDLAWSLTPSKLFRRSLVLEHELRFREELPVYSDGPFVLEAYFRARRISVLADYDYYFLVARSDGGNITYTSRLHDRLRGISAGVEVTARCAPPGHDRDVVNSRHLRGDLANLFRAEFLALPRAEQESLCADAGTLVRSHLTDPIRSWCSEAQRLKLHCVQYGLVDELIVLVRHECEQAGPLQALDVTATAWTGSRRAPALEVRARPPQSLSALSGEPVAHALPTAERAAGGGRQVEFRATTRPDADPYRVVISLPALLPRPRQGDPLRERWSLRLEAEFAGRLVAIPVPADSALQPVRWWHRGRPYRATALRGSDGALVLAIAPVSIRRALSLRLRRVLPTSRSRPAS